ncbi:laccase 2 [Penicillium longicatenatum]|uniref:laccase 2 n=1 Tax=Penicillium longicatenatum TaxID=1561947 RepID=UPI0025465A5B|nr:laccase 2 [Penicillium longicatenatum]KAJ5658160.1 laccase 2 [Penicillium longicatenatum]
MKLLVTLLGVVVTRVTAALAQAIWPLLCENGPNTRGCWGNYSIDTNFYEQIPFTGVTREYWFVVENITMAPDGYLQNVIAINRSIPGPTIEADWGDKVVVHVTNMLEANGTSIHWHGIRQKNNNLMDGTPGVTQCPIPPGKTFTYEWRAEQYGTASVQTWYHSHFSMQYSVGLQGPIIIHGPATANYEEDLGTVILQDWSHVSPFTMWWYARLPTGPPSLASALINGKNVFDCTGSKDPNCLGNGTRSEWHFEQGKTYRIRIINTGLYSNFRFAIDGHNLTVIANDLVPIIPYVTDNACVHCVLFFQVVISMGQRYDIVVQATAPPGNYWLRAIWQTSCCPNDYANNTLGIIRYDNTSAILPTTSNPALYYLDNCGDEPLERLVPHLPLNVGPPARTDVFNLYEVTLPLPKGFLWTLNNTYLWTNYSQPTNRMLAEHNSSFPAEYHVYRTPDTPDSWVYLVFNDISGRNRSHPMHLHGHDFFVLATGNGSFIPGQSILQRTNPPRRDTATWAKRGYLVLAFKTDNPGSWLMHCHIVWHSSQSLGLQMLERPGDLALKRDEFDAMESMCNAWDAYWNRGGNYVQEDAGI